MSGWINEDGFVKSPSVPLGAGLRGNFVVAAHLLVRLTPQFLRALHLELFMNPSLWNSGNLRIEGAVRVGSEACAALFVAAQIERGLLSLKAPTQIL
jgi:hypothetical protein